MDQSRNSESFLFRAGDLPLETITIGDSDTDGSVTIDNDPDRLYYLDYGQSGPDSRQRTPTPCPLRPQNQRDVVDLTQESFDDGDYLTDECFERLLPGWGNAGPGEATPPAGETPGKRTVEEACVDGIVYRPGQSLELYDNTHRTRSYLRIAIVLEDSTGAIYFRGRHLTRTVDHPETYIPKEKNWENELVWDVNETGDFPLGMVKRFVNINFTSCCRIEEDHQKQNRPYDLFCRLKEEKMKEEKSFSVEYLSSEESDKGFQFESASLRQSWRGETRLFGDMENSSLPSPVIVLDDLETTIDLTRSDSVMDQKRQRRYTFGDGFCGAGGVSSGARRAGLHIKWAFDQSEHAIATYRLNFESAICEQSDIFSFLTSDPEFLKVDVSHGSPPCQTFSPAHTINSANDDANSACIFSCSNLIKQSKPRVHTMEETSGLPERHKQTFFRVIQDFIEIGYSIRWVVLNCMDYGVPQSRKRLLIIASGPGETLPSFPRPTHGHPGSGLAGYTTINHMISNIPRNAPDHDVEAAKGRGMRNGARAPFDPNQQAKTITCGGGDNNYHPSGKRGFTNREFACLQTFPLDHRFGPREVRKQIGNAVPPALAGAIYREIIESLQRTDEMELRKQLEKVN